MSKKKSKTTNSGDLPALRIGSRVRCTDDGMLGKITWANGVSVKIAWDDGEQVTWRRNELAGKPIEILDADEATVAVPEQVATTEQTEPVTETAPATSEPAVATEPAATDATATAFPKPIAEAPATEPAAPTPEPTAPGSTDGTTPPLAIFAPETAAPAKPKRERKAKAPAEPKEKKVSALDAAAKVLAESGQAMTCKEMVGAMAIKGYWSSPGGKTPDATLCSAILREIKLKGDQSRFVKVGPGRFTLRTTA